METANPDRETLVLKDHVLASTPEPPEELHRSISRIVRRLCKADWVLLYDSVTRELTIRARVVQAPHRARFERWSATEFYSWWFE